MPRYRSDPGGVEEALRHWLNAAANNCAQDRSGRAFSVLSSGILVDLFFTGRAVRCIGISV